MDVITGKIVQLTKIFIPGKRYLTDRQNRACHFYLKYPVGGRE